MVVRCEAKCNNWLQIQYNEFDTAWVMEKSGDIILLDLLHQYVQHRLVNVMNHNSPVVVPSEIIELTREELREELLKKRQIKKELEEKLEAELKSQREKEKEIEEMLQNKKKKKKEPIKYERRSEKKKNRKKNHQNNETDFMTSEKSNFMESTKLSETMMTNKTIPEEENSNKSNKRVE